MTANEHLRKWIDFEFEHDTEETRDKMQAEMQAIIDQDPEYWPNQSYWRVFEQTSFADYVRKGF